MFLEGPSLLQDTVGEHLHGRLRPGGGAGYSPRVCPPRLCKEWVQVPSPEQFFQPLYVSHSGDFKVGDKPLETSTPPGVACTRSPGVQETIPVGQSCCQNDNTGQRFPAKGPSWGVGACV